MGVWEGRRERERARDERDGEKEMWKGRGGERDGERDGKKGRATCPKSAGWAGRQETQGRADTAA